MAQKCSVVIPAYNAAGFIRRTIDSVLAQTYSDYELIVVDDGSTDDTAEVVKSYGERVRYIYQENAGGGAGRNTGIAAAEYDWIALLDHDDEWLPEKLQAQMDLLERNPDLRWCGTNYYKECLGRKALVGIVKALRIALGDVEYFESVLTAVCKKGCRLVPSTMTIHKEIFEELGGFSHIHLADLDMWWRIAHRFPKIGYLPQPLATIHLAAQDEVSTKLRMASKRGEETWKFIGRHLEIAKEMGALEEFKPTAAKFLHNSLLTTLYHGFKTDSRTTIRRFRRFFPWYWRLATYILTVFPRLTAALMHATAYVAHVLRLERQISRRWIRHPRTESK